MALSLNKPKLDNLAGDIWKSAEWLRGKFKAYEYQSVNLPTNVSRRRRSRDMASLMAQSGLPSPQAGSSTQQRPFDH